MAYARFIQFEGNHPTIILDTQEKIVHFPTYRDKFTLPPAVRLNDKGEFHDPLMLTQYKFHTGTSQGQTYFELQRQTWIECKESIRSVINSLPY